MSPAARSKKTSKKRPRRTTARGRNGRNGRETLSAVRATVTIRRRRPAAPIVARGAKQAPALDLTKRMSVRTRPEGSPILHQTWDKLLFLHWRVEKEALRPLIPQPLAIDLHHGSAWVGITPFTIRDSRLTLVPPLPWARNFHEVNVRTYVHLDGVPGVWFFSLDASSPLAVLGARTFFQLPYHHAEITLEEEGRRIHCHAERTEGEPPARIRATWTPGPESRRAEQGSLEYFWVERYCLYTAYEDTLYRARIFHEPWPIRDVPTAHYETNLLDANGIGASRQPDQARLLAAGPVNADIWPIEEVGTAS